MDDKGLFSKVEEAMHRLRLNRSTQDAYDLADAALELAGDMAEMARADVSPSASGKQREDEAG